MKKYLLVIVLAALGWTQTFYPTADAYISQGDPSTNFGTQGWLITYGNPWSLVYRTLMRFDLSSLPPGTPISAATVSLYMWDQAGVDFNVDIHKVLASWTETGVTWSNQPSFNATVESSLPYQGYTWWHFTITALVQDWVNNPGSNYGMILRNNPEIPGDNGGRFAKFYSRDTTINRPYLLITAVNIEENKCGDLSNLQVKPNPFNEKTSITFSTSKTSKDENIAVYLYNVEGRKIKTIREGKTTPGYHCIQISSEGIPAGTYFLIIKSEKTSRVIRTVIVK
ncbi:MAG TPA: DNRLRE domain-containing protein [bacterium]